MKISVQYYFQFLRTAVATCWVKSNEPYFKSHTHCETQCKVHTCLTLDVDKHKTHQHLQIYTHLYTYISRVPATVYETTIKYNRWPGKSSHIKAKVEGKAKVQLQPISKAALTEPPCGRFTPQKASSSLVQEVGRTTEQGKPRPTGIRYLDLPGRSQAVYRLSYPGRQHW